MYSIREVKFEKKENTWRVAFVFESKKKSLFNRDNTNFGEQFTGLCIPLRTVHLPDRNNLMFVNRVRRASMPRVGYSNACSALKGASPARMARPASYP